MKLTELIKHLNKISEQYNGLSVDVLVETEDCQYQFPANDVAVVMTKEGYPKRVIIMHEKEIENGKS